MPNFKDMEKLGSSSYGSKITQTPYDSLIGKIVKIPSELSAGDFNNESLVLKIDTIINLYNVAGYCVGGVHTDGRYYWITIGFMGMQKLTENENVSYLPNRKTKD